MITQTRRNQDDIIRFKIDLSYEDRSGAVEQKRPVEGKRLHTNVFHEPFK